MIVWEGSSLVDGAPIVAIATQKTRNQKTGGVIQTWIMRQEAPPYAAAKSGLDQSVCGSCIHRPVNLGSCYVVTQHAPTAVWRAWRNGTYRPFTKAAFAGQKVRLGAYGDPAAVPVDVWEQLLVGTVGHTGYTHQWRTCDQRLSLICMASVDTHDEAESARSMGWRTFRVRRSVDDPLHQGELVCPAAAESTAKRPLTCAECLACSGTSSGRNANVAIVVHGASFRVSAFQRAFET